MGAVPLFLSAATTKHCIISVYADPAYLIVLYDLFVPVVIRALDQGKGALGVEHTVFVY
jgi:hypothetical protein